MKKSNINFEVSLDENNLPTSITWEATDGGEKSKCKSLMIAMWDELEKNTLRIDLWTKDMMVDEMKIFFHQTLLSMADTLQKATGEEAMSKEMKAFANNFAEKLNLIQKN